MKIPKLSLHFHKFITVKIMNNYECCVCAKCHKKKVMNATEGLHLPDESYHHWLNEKNFVPSNPEGFIFYSMRRNSIPIFVLSIPSVTLIPSPSMNFTRKLPSNFELIASDTDIKLSSPYTTMETCASKLL